MNGNLLEFLSQESGLFISSLKGPGALPSVLKLLCNLTSEDYPVEEWNYCLSYLLEQKVQLESYKQVASFLSAQRDALTI